MILDLRRFLTDWLPRFETSNRSYLTAPSAAPVVSIVRFLSLRRWLSTSAASAARSWPGTGN